MGTFPTPSVRPAHWLLALSLLIGVPGVRPAWADEPARESSAAAAISLEAKVAAALAPVQESEEQRLRREHAVAFARQRVREILERKRAAALETRATPASPP